MQADDSTEPTSKRLMALGAATLGEAGGRPMDPRIRRVWKPARLAGRAHTAACPPGDNLAIHAAVATAPPGSVLVVEIGAGQPYGYWGEVLSTGAQARGIAGLVIDGGVRDVEALERKAFPVFAAAVALRGAQKVGPGRVGSVVEVGAVAVREGDWVVGDADGVTVIAAEELDEVMAQGRARADAEKELFRSLSAERTTVDLLGLDIGAVQCDV